MTSYEHAMVGINGALAVGLHRRFGWQIVALAGLSANLPDWDALTILFGQRCFADGHRLWGHNLLVAGLLATAVSALLYYTNALSKAHKWLAGHIKAFVLGDTSPERRARRTSELWVWIAVGVVAAYSHLLVDIAFSAGKDLPTWGVPLLWPFSRATWSYPLVLWGDPGATIILAAFMFAMIRWPVRTRLLAAASLLAVVAYAFVRGTC